MTHLTLDNIDYIVTRVRDGFVELVGPSGEIRFIHEDQLGPTTEVYLPIIPTEVGRPFPLRPRDFLRELQDRRTRSLTEYHARSRRAKSTDPDSPSPRSPTSAVKAALVGVPPSLHENILKALASRRKK